MKANGAWIFLSYSTEDIDKVRIVRNCFEECGHNPIMFYLNCMQTDTTAGREELDELIKREIDARQWFVFCESPNAAESPYVQMEREYILGSKKRNIWSIDMSMSIDRILERVRSISKDLMIYVYSLHRNMYFKIIETIEKKLEEAEYTITFPGQKGFENRGFIVFLIHEEDIGKACFPILKEQLIEFTYAFKERMIPVFVGDFDHSVIKEQVDIDMYNPIKISKLSDGVEQIIDRIKNNQQWDTARNCRNIYNGIEKTMQELVSQEDIPMVSVSQLYQDILKEMIKLEK